jgi:hypothetical protein
MIGEFEELERHKFERSEPKESNPFLDIYLQDQEMVKE